MKNKENIKKVTYIFLTLVSTVFSTENQSYAEELEIPVKQGNIRVFAPKIREDKVDPCWKGSNLIGQNNFPKIYVYEPKRTKKGEVYTAIRDRIINKYKKDIPGLEKYKASAPLRQKPKTNLKSASIEFHKQAHALAEKMKEKNEETSEYLKTSLKMKELTLKSLIDKLIKNTDSNKEAQNILNKVQQSLFNLID